MAHPREPSVPSRDGAPRRAAAAALVLLGAAFLGPLPARAQDTPERPAWTTFDAAANGTPAHRVGDAACAACHREKVATFHDTAHFRTSSLPSAETIHGKFGPEDAILRTVNPDLVFTMEANERGFFQTAHMKTSATEELSRSERFDFVIGSGRKGQTYLFWDGDQLFELPVSYWTSLDRWVNSPGYIDGRADFERSTPPRCLECHSSYFESRRPPENRYVKAGFVLGITCERCHGPGSEHVARFGSSSPPKDESQFAIINPSRLSRARKLDACALCHAGSGTPLVSSFSFVPGEDLSGYVAFARLAPKARVDVHASQIQLLERSRCFRSTTTLTCLTCHDVHSVQRDADSFSSRCLGCHKVESCGRFAALGRAIESKCVGCHMPLEQTAKIISGVDGVSVQPMVRNHQIAIYPESAPP